MLKLVNSSKDNMQRELVSNLYKEELYDELLYESDEVGQKRKVNSSYFRKDMVLMYLHLEMHRGIGSFETSEENHSIDRVDGGLETTTKQLIVICSLVFRYLYKYSLRWFRIVVFTASGISLVLQNLPSKSKLTKLKATPSCIIIYIKAIIFSLRIGK